MLLLSLMLPPMPSTITLLQLRPIPMLWSLTRSKFCFFWSSKKGSKSICCRSSLIPMPVSTTSVTNIYRWDPNSMSSPKVMTKCPRKELYLTAFWTTLKRMSWYFSQSVIIIFLNSLVLAKYTWMFRYLIVGKNGSSTFCTNYSGKFFALSFKSNWSLLIFMR